MKTNNIGLKILIDSEGFSSKPYVCPAGVPTIGYGTTRYPNGSYVKMSDGEISRETALEYLKNDLTASEQVVTRFVKPVISENSFSALSVFVYNVGENNFKKSTLLKLINQNPNDMRIKSEFMRWVYGGGKKLVGLEIRRKREADLYFK